MSLLNLFLSFLKIGSFTFGGGHAMIPLIQEEILRQKWMSIEELVNFIAISESTPGPFAINISTFVGLRVNGVIGSICSTIGVILTSFILILIIAKCFEKFKENKIVKYCMFGLKPAVVALIGTAIITTASAVFFPNGNILEIEDATEYNIWKALNGETIGYGVLFLLCVLTVADIVPYIITLLIVVAVVALLDRKVFRKVDYSLLVTFIGFFVFIGNMGRVPAFNALLKQVIEGNEILTAVGASQFMSNVPAALLLSGFTNRYDLLIVGTNLGGLGTLIASMASLISFKYIGKEYKVIENNLVRNGEVITERGILIADNNPIRLFVENIVSGNQLRCQVLNGEDVNSGILYQISINIEKFIFELENQLFSPQMVDNLPTVDRDYIYDTYKIYKPTDYIVVPMQFSNNVANNLHQEYILENEFFNKESKKSINRIIDMEKNIYYPAYENYDSYTQTFKYELIDELVFDLHFRSRDLETWAINDDYDDKKTWNIFDYYNNTLI